MKAILITVALAAFLSPMAQAVEIEPMNIRPETYQVDGKDVTSSEAIVAGLQGKMVKLCKAQTGANATKTYQVNGKEIKGTDVRVCTVMKLAEKKTGLGFKKK